MLSINHYIFSENHIKYTEINNMKQIDSNASVKQIGKTNVQERMLWLLDKFITKLYYNFFYFN